MVQSTLPFGINDLMQLAESIAHGLELHGPWIGLKQPSTPEFRFSLETLRMAETNFASAVSAKAEASKRTIEADQALRAWLAKARLAVMLARGGRWSETWLDTGFTHRGTNVPKRIATKIALARAVAAFFARNPEFAVRHANVTASHGQEAHDKIVNARISLRDISSECAASKLLRDAAERKLRRKMLLVISTLTETIEPADPRWLAFGLNQPKRGRTRRVRSVADAAPITVLSKARPERAAAA